jgi:hypothetical protein
MYDLILIGYGIAHMSLLLALSTHTTTLNVCIIDPHFDGGDLHRRWASVQSNTTWQQFLDAVQQYCSDSRFKALVAERPSDATVPLGQLVRAYESVVRAAVQFPVTRIYGFAEEAKHADGIWTVAGVQGRRISYAPGADPKSIAYQVPRLSLESVLTGGAVSRIRRGDHIIVFGLSHSGTLAVDALLKCGASVTAVYKTAQPFMYARDGVYGGIKQESAAIADRLIASGEATLIRADDIAAVTNALLGADWIVAAVGFVGRKIDFYVDGVVTEVTALPAAHLWGIAYPKSVHIDESTYYDVSLAGFLTHCEQNVAKVLQQ